MNPAFDDRAIVPQSAPLAPVSNTDERSVVSILTGLWEKTEVLVRQEMKLASAELDQKMDKAKRELIALGLCGGLLFAGLSSLVAAVILLLAEAVEPWIAAGIVGLAATAGGYLLAQREKHAAAELVPERTIESIKKDVKTIREASP